MRSGAPKVAWNKLNSSARGVEELPSWGTSTLTPNHSRTAQHTLNCEELAMLKKSNCMHVINPICLVTLGLSGSADATSPLVYIQLANLNDD